MPEPLSITASTIAIATLAYESTKSLTDFIDSLKNAPKLISDLKGDVSAVQGVIRSLETMLENRDDRNLPAELRVCLSSAKVPLEDCQAVSKDFELKLKVWFHDSKWDKFKANFKETNIEKFRMRMRDTRDTLHLALTVCSFKFNGIRAEEAKGFEVGMERQLHILTGKLEGMEIGRQEVLEAAEGLNEQSHQLSFQQDDLVRRLAKHERLLREALKFCTTGLLETGKKTGKFAQMVKTTDRARAIVAVLTQVTGDMPGGIEINTLIAEGDSRAVVITDDANFALEFLK